MIASDRNRRQADTVDVLTRASRKAMVVLCLVATAVVARGERRIDRLEWLQLQRLVCYGLCPSYTVTIEAGGRVTFTGALFVPVESAERKASATEIDALVVALNKAKFLHFLDRYETPEDGCDNVVTDFPRVVLSARFDGVSKSVRHYHGCWTSPPPPPPRVQKMPPDSPFLPAPYQPYELGCPFPMALLKLENRVDAILNTESWVGKVPPPFERCSNNAVR
jgi:hypothetical protein